MALGPLCCIGASCRPIRPGWNQQLNGGADGPVSESFQRRQGPFVERHRSSGSGLAGSGELRSSGPQRPRPWIRPCGSVHRDAPWQWPQRHAAGSAFRRCPFHRDDDSSPRGGHRHGGAGPAALQASGDPGLGGEDSHQSEPGECPDAALVSPVVRQRRAHLARPGGGHGGWHGAPSIPSCGSWRRRWCGCRARRSSRWPAGISSGSAQRTAKPPGVSPDRPSQVAKIKLSGWRRPARQWEQPAYGPHRLPSC